MKIGFSIATIIICISLFPSIQAGISDNLLAYYKFEGNTDDETGNFNAINSRGLTSSPGVSRLSYDFYSMLGNSYSYVDIGNNPGLNLTTDMTISAWIYAFEYSEGIIASRWAPWGGIQNKSWQLYQSSDENIKFQISSGSTYDEINGGTFELNTWHHVAATFEDGVMKIYVDGTLIDEKISPITSINVHLGLTTRIGSVYCLRDDCDLEIYPPRNFNGKIDEVRIYNRALSQEEINDVILADRPEACSELVEGHNGPKDDRINFVFYFVNETDLDNVIGITRERFYAFMSQFTPFNQNMDKFNFWYLNQIIPGGDDLNANPDLKCFNTSCKDLLEDYWDVCGTGDNFIPFTYCLGGYECSVSVGRENGWFFTSFYSLHGTMHDIGHYFGDTAEEYDWGFDGTHFHRKPNKLHFVNCKETIQDAQTEWGDMIGNGCGEDGVIDCPQPDGKWGPYTMADNEVVYYVGNPARCFTPDPVEYCYYSTREKRFKALTQSECENFYESCVYFNGDYMLIDRTESPAIEGEYVDLFNTYEDIYRPGGCQLASGEGVWPHFKTIMRTNLANNPKPDTYGFGPVSERKILQEIMTLTGGCVFDTDCGEGYICENHTCVDAPAEPGPGDLNNDSYADIFDLVIIGSNFNTDVDPGHVSDPTGDDRCDVADLMIVAVNFGNTYT